MANTPFPTLDDMLAIVKPHNDKIVAEHRAEEAERINAELLASLKELVGALPQSPYGDTREHCERLDRARAAITKAEASA